MRVALTGTPGVGKTTLAAQAAKHGWRVVDVKDWAAECGLVVGRDEEDEADVIDVDALCAMLPRDDGAKVLYEGHLAHLLPLDAVWVIRADPEVLGRRLESRGYTHAKVRENQEAEALDIILQESLEMHQCVVQRDGTRRSPEELYKAFAEVHLESLKAPDLEAVDWTDWFHA
jgi:adenylate kinase